MSFCTVNGLSIEIKHKSWSEESEDVTDMGRTPNGTLFMNTTAYKRRWRGRVPLTVGALSAALRDWIKANFQYANFESSVRTNMGATPTVVGTFSTSTSQKKFGSRGGLISSGGSAAYALGTQFATKWTMVVWKRTALNTFTHYAINSDGVQYKAGAVHTPSGGDSVVNWATIASGTFTLLGKDVGGTNSANAFYDELLFFPFILDVTMIAALAARTASLNFTPCTVLLGGDTVGGTEVPCCGMVSSLSNTFTVSSNTASEIDFQLTER